MSKKKRTVNKFKGYFLEDCDCRFCMYGKKKGCTCADCCCEDERSDAIAHGRIKRKRGSTRWDG